MRYALQEAPLKRLDAKLDGLAAVVKLEHLIEREGGWGATASWGDTMSLGAPPLLALPSRWWQM